MNTNLLKCIIVTTFFYTATIAQAKGATNNPFFFKKHQSIIQLYSRKRIYDKFELLVFAISLSFPCTHYSRFFINVVQTSLPCFV